MKAGQLYDDIIRYPDVDVVEEVLSSKALWIIMDKLTEEKHSMENHRTAKLWLQYMEMIGILRMFIKAEITGYWALHVQTIQAMLPYFAAAGHNLYAKSAHMYLQTMLELPETHPDIHSSFLNGLHVIRMSERYWAGLSTNLIIEQVLMRSTKTNGGLTRGRGLTEIQRVIWLFSMPFCADVSQAMNELTVVSCDISEQHNDTTPSRLKRDTNDTHTVLKMLKDLDPFGSDPQLRVLVTGVYAHESVNADDAKTV